MGLILLSIILFIQALVAGQQLESAPPNSSWISHLRVLGDGCSSATAEVAPDSSSFTITWKFNQPDQALLAAGSQATAGTRKLTCGVAFVLEMPPAQSNRSAIFLDSERSGSWQVESGSQAEIQSSMAALSALWPSEPESIKLSASDPFLVTSPIYATGEMDRTEESVEVPGRDRPLYPMTCASIANSNIGPSSGDYSMWGNSITMLESFELLDTEGQMSLPSAYEHKVSLFWLEPCLTWYSDRPKSGFL